MDNESPRSDSKPPSLSEACKARKASIITPGPSKLDNNKRVSGEISPTDEPYAVMTDAEAWRLLEANFSLIHVFDKY